MDVLAALLQMATYAVLAACLCRPALSRVAAGLAGGTALVCLLYGMLGPGTRELVTTHTFVAYEGMAYAPGPVHFPTGTVVAAGWQWPLPFVAFAALWAVLALRLGKRTTARNPYLLPMLLGWSAMAAWLGMEALAAPSAVVQPYGLDRFLWPAGMALAVQLATVTRRLLPLLMQLALCTTALRLPAALFSKVASDRGWGTSLDISGIVDIVHPLTRMQFEPPLLAGSGEQQFWLIWAEHVFAFPAFHMLSFTGIAFAVWLMHKHRDTPA